MGSRLEQMKTARKLKLPVASRGSCRWCGTEVKPPRRRWCSQACVDAYLVRADPGHARGLVFARDQGVCALCGLNTEALKRQLTNLVRRWRGWNGRTRLAAEGRQLARDLLTARLAELKVRGFNVEVSARGLGWKALWEVDHIVPVAEGGGGCSLENLRTLCIPCHKRATRALRQRMAGQPGSRPS